MFSDVLEYVRDIFVTKTLIHDHFYDTVGHYTYFPTNFTMFLINILLFFCIVLILSVCESR